MYQSKDAPTLVNNWVALLAKIIEESKGEDTKEENKTEDTKEEEDKGNKTQAEDSGQEVDDDNYSGCSDSDFIY